MNTWLSCSVPPFLILDQYGHFIGESYSCQETRAGRSWLSQGPKIQSFLHGSDHAIAEPLFIYTPLFGLFLAHLLTLLFIGGRFLPSAIYSQTDSPQECQSNDKFYETNAHAGTL
jgi:hypothetical protein